MHSALVTSACATFRATRAEHMRLTYAVYFRSLEACHSWLEKSTCHWKLKRELSEKSFLPPHSVLSKKYLVRCVLMVSKRVT